jgi:hypothetical protein
MASSSGWAISKHIRLLYRRGKLRANGDDDVADRVQKMKTADIAKPNAMKVDVDGAMAWLSRVFNWLITPQTKKMRYATPGPNDEVIPDNVNQLGKEARN